MNTHTIKTKKRQAQEAIDKAVAEFMANGGKVQAETVREVNPDEAAHRYYAMSELVEDGE
jgi:hypothetical protein